MRIELNCPTCANNRFDFPQKDSDPVLCQFCGDSIGTLAEVKQKVADQAINRARL
jgi:ribosomal protein S27E